MFVVCLLLWGAAATRVQVDGDSSESGGPLALPLSSSRLVAGRQLRQQHRKASHVSGAYSQGPERRQAKRTSLGLPTKLDRQLGSSRAQRTSLGLPTKVDNLGLREQNGTLGVHARPDERPDDVNTLHKLFSPEPTPRQILRERLVLLEQYNAELSDTDRIFVDDCAAAADKMAGGRPACHTRGNATGRRGRISCGNVLTCFLTLFTPEPPVLRRKIGANLSIGARKILASSAPEHLSHHVNTQKPYLQTAPFNGFSGEVEVGNIVDENELLKTFEGRGVLRDAMQMTVDSLMDELLKVDRSSALPRIFMPFLQWNRCTVGSDDTASPTGNSTFTIRKKEYKRETGVQQNHVFAIVKQANGRYHVLQGYCDGDSQKGYDLNEWLRSGNPLATPFDNDGLGILESALNTFVQKSGLPEVGFDSDSHRTAFNVGESQYTGFPYAAKFTYTELEDRSLPGGLDLPNTALDAETVLTKLLLEVELDDREDDESELASEDEESERGLDQN